MSKELENNINSLQALAYATMHPIFMASYLNVRRTGKILTLNGLGLEQQTEEELTY